MDLTNPLYESRWAELRGLSERWYFGIPTPYTGLYTPHQVAAAAGQTRWASEFARIREASDLLLFSHVRHVWGVRSWPHPDLKGTDRLLRGIALFKQRNPGISVNLITFEYGTHVRESKALVAELRLGDSVHWFPKTLRKDLMCGVLGADVICAEFEYSWLSSGVVYEALAMAKPILGFRNDELYRGQYPSLYPIMNARSPERICARLEQYMSAPEAHRAMGERGLQWYRDHVVSPAIDRYVSFIETRDARPDAPAP
jgi:glycosyltransferase involved in cell wall biosynthesis